ncbi:MAG TPA: RNA polymerase recycling motor HelD, partial [Bacillales bacterium]|nr:RNA polymerase recycling motor HelD [Bacillales bacterium]
HLKESIVTLRKSFWEDVTVNVENADDRIETEASIRQQAELLSERERNHGNLYTQLKKLDRLHSSPYFGRIDFHEQGEEKTESLYIGIASLMDEKDEDFLIYDWRAPISSMYYDYAPGPAQYETLDGTIKGEMKLKRQFIIQNGKITGMFDTGLTIGDRLLQQLLGSHGSTAMKNIVATIQREQNQIIRNEKSRLLIVQGVAGSGKTSAALQRVAYLLYAHRKTLKADNMILFSPNPLFNSYVSTVLPELGEENMRQTTFQEYVEDQVGKDFHLQDQFEQMESFLRGEMKTAQEKAIQLKASLDFKKYIDDYVDRLRQRGLIFQSILFRDKPLIQGMDIYVDFYKMDPGISIPNRIELLKERLLRKLSGLQQMEMKKSWVEEEIQYFDKEDYLEAFKESQKDQESDEDTFDDYEKEQKFLSKMVVEKHFSPIREKIQGYGFVDLKASYSQFFEQNEKDLSEDWAEISEWTLANLREDRLTWEDATPFLYFSDRIKGRNRYRQIRHVVLDEVQDYSPFELSYIRGLFPKSQMTVLGDVHQAIHTHALETPSILSEVPDDLKSFERIQLMRSYRSTRQIVEFTKQILKDGDSVIPFEREGNLPVVRKAEDEGMLHKEIVKDVKDFQGAGHQTIAVICKTLAESRKAYEALKENLPVQFMDQQTYSFQKGILVIPAYLAKGIEFDAVLIYNASEDVYGREAERNLFYTACTRAMHDLHLYHLGEKSPFFTGIAEGNYQESIDQPNRFL